MCARLSQMKFAIGLIVLFGLSGTGCGSRPNSDAVTSQPPAPAREPNSGPPAAEGPLDSHSSPVPADGKQQPASNAALAWRREGGFAGFCDDLKVSTTGELRATSCRSTPDRSKTGKLAKEDLARFDRWRKSFGSVVINTKDSPAADAMTLTLTMKGIGSGQPTEAERQEILGWAQKIYEQNRP